ncbi:hypothetical protein C1637_17055 [Chryseobacterium lactis]|uniref:Uncharacterized protein n=1 Tax=Chryseobacterium lactis TaxID=1241981 RepID=A0A3G6RN30_CHRLC|nr:hypothetical protein [Chryseobacterium lactis]AZA84191.1 hypothetical protein EG342_20895 [Chryseobacterium lactis]AZB04579.1 hypothetical protein EG341_11775 [Chryseobacterium lactis]PNW12746.1 hypothetical protein C1637_17055 [Chryseobacterium lactis]
MIEKTPAGYLLALLLFFSSCSQESSSSNKSGISMETISVITFVIVGIAILAVYYTTKKK